MAEARDFMTVGELAEHVGKTPRAVRLYEEMGLLHPRGRSCGNYREYGAEALVRLRWICHLHDLGLELSDVKAFLDCVADATTAGEAMTSVRGHYARTLDRLDAQLNRLKAMRDGLVESLDWLEACAGCTVDANRISRTCGSCGRHGEGPEPALVQGVKAQPIHPHAPGTASDKERS